MKKILIVTLLSVVGVSYAASIKKVEVKKDEGIRLGYPVVGIVEEGEAKTAVYKGIVFVLRPDGSVGWEMSPELRKRFERDMKSGKPLPILYKTTQIQVK